MGKKIKIFMFCAMLLIASSLISCATSGVSVGVGVYVPGAWVTPPYGGYYPPVGIGIPVY